jgi:hypothetical protein
MKGAHEELRFSLTCQELVSLCLRQTNDRRMTGCEVRGRKYVLSERKLLRRGSPFGRPSVKLLMLFAHVR